MSDIDGNAARVAGASAGARVIKRWRREEPLAGLHDHGLRDDGARRQKSWGGSQRSEVGD